MRKIIAVAVYAWLSCGVSAQQATISAPRGIQVPNLTLNGGLPKWQTCRAKVIAGTANCKILIIGESGSTGQTSLYNAAASDAHSGAWANHMANVLRTIYNLNAQTNSISGDANIGISTTFNSFDTRATVSTWAADTTPFTLGGHAWFNVDTTNTFIFKPTDTASYPSTKAINTDTLDVYWYGNTSGSGIISVSVNGGATVGTINTTTASKQYNLTSISATLGNNAWDLKCDTLFGCEWNVLVARNSAVKEVSIINGAFSGATSVQWTYNASNPWDPIAAIEKIAPDLCIMPPIGDDVVAGTSIPTYTANITALAQACQMSGDVLFWTEWNGPSGTSQEPFNAAIISVASSLNAPVFDTYTMLGGSPLSWFFDMNAGGNGACCGATADTAHFGGPAYMYLGAIFAQILMQ